MPVPGGPPCLTILSQSHKAPILLISLLSHLPPREDFWPPPSKWPSTSLFTPSHLLLHFLMLQLAPQHYKLLYLFIVYLHLLECSLLGSRKYAGFSFCNLST